MILKLEEVILQEVERIELMQFNGKFSRTSRL